ncbi:MAG: type 1 glutamine amidotransferase domain-containing protein [Solirubrobacterales bacterium]|nr:type 1 glutamine amidotransferase domain-containing protein [Solirubrobacterales bacterium]MBV9800396.1 type 1 glutamine amidotransferase domain-containing protein [Solirubrobacterales bacterium]
MPATNEQIVTDHHMRVDTISSKPKKVLIVVSNPAVASTVGWAVGFWAAELTHPYYELTERGVEVTIASPGGGKVEMDALSDPRDPSKWSSEDLITMGFVNTPELMALLESTPKLADLDLDEFDAIMVAGGLAPMFTFRDNEHVHNALRHFYEAEKPTCIYCHGTAALVDLTLSDGSRLVEGKTVTGFSNLEEDYSDSFVGQRVMPFRLEDTLKERGANYVQGGLFKAFVVRDGRLITGQQQYSGRKVAQALIEALGI